MMSRAKLVLVSVAVILLMSTPSMLAENREGRRGEAAKVAGPTTESCVYVNDPSLYVVSPEQNQAALSTLTASVVSYVKPVIIRSAPLLPVQRNNFIDEHIFGQMEVAGIEAASLSSDTEFLRRVTLDLTGRIPSRDQVVNFVNNPNPGKRNGLIDSFVTSPEYVAKWTMFFGDLFKLNGRSSNINRYTQGRDAFYLYLRDSINQNKPYDQLVQEMLTAEGDNHTNGAVNYLVGGRIPMGPIQDTYDGQAAQVASMFLGIQVVDCLLCHDGTGRLESVNLWGATQTRLEMWALSAFFSQTRIRGERISNQPRLIRYSLVPQRRRPGYHLNTDDGNRSSREPQGGVTEVEPFYPFTTANDTSGGVAEGQSRREALADFVVNDMQFARAAVNYIWEELMVQAFVTPSNAFDPARLDPDNPPPAPWTLQPTNARLLDAMATWFQQNSFDIRQLIALITKSRAYQLSAAYPTAWSPEYVPYYARRFARRMDAKEIHDAVVKATGVPANYRFRSRTGTILDPVQWAMQLPDTREPSSNRRVRDFLDSFGRGDRDLTERQSAGSPLQALNLMNHRFIMDRINANNSRSTIGVILAAANDPTEIIQKLYLSTLSRFPTQQETALLMPMMVQLGNADGAESLQWILMNKLDFVFNY